MLSEFILYGLDDGFIYTINQIKMEKVFLVNEYQMGCCDLEASQIRVYADKESAELYAKEMNETEEALEFIDCYDYLGIKYKYRVVEQEVYSKHN